MKKIAVFITLFLLFLLGSACAEGALFVPGEETTLLQAEEFRLCLTGNFREIRDDRQYPEDAIALEYHCINNSGKNVKFSFSANYLNEQPYGDWSLDFTPVVKAGKTYQGELILDPSKADAPFSSFGELESLLLAMNVWPENDHTAILPARDDYALYFSREAMQTANIAAVSGEETVLFSRYGIEMRLLSWEHHPGGRTYFRFEAENKNRRNCTLRSNIITMNDCDFCVEQLLVDDQLLQENVLTLPAQTTLPFQIILKSVRAQPQEMRMSFELETSGFIDLYAWCVSGRIMLYDSWEDRAADTQTFIVPPTKSPSPSAAQSGFLFMPGEELAITDDKAFALHLTGEYRDAENDPACPRGTVYLGYRIENRSTFKAELAYTGYLNGVRILDSFTALGKPISPGETAAGELRLNSAETGVYFETLADLETLHLFISPFNVSEDCYETLLPSRKVVFRESCLHTANLAVVPGREQVIFSEQDITITLTDWFCMGETALLYCRLDNRSPEDVWVICSGAVNQYNVFNNLPAFINGWTHTYVNTGTARDMLIVMDALQPIDTLDTADLYLDIDRRLSQGTDDPSHADYFSGRVGRLKFYNSEAEKAADTKTLIVPLPEMKAPYIPPVDPMHEYTDREIIQRVQEAMNSLGYECGTPDGLIGKKTRAALAAFQQAHGLAKSGSVTHQTAQLLEELGYGILGE